MTASQELVAPVVEALVTVRRLLAVGGAYVLHPLDKQALVFLQHQKLPQHHTGLKVKH